MSARASARTGLVSEGNGNDRRTQNGTVSSQGEIGPEGVHLAFLGMGLKWLGASSHQSPWFGPMEIISSDDSKAFSPSKDAFGKSRDNTNDGRTGSGIFWASLSSWCPWHPASSSLSSSSCAVDGVQGQKTSSRVVTNRYKLQWASNYLNGVSASMNVTTISSLKMLGK